MTLLINPNNLLSLYFRKKEKKKKRDIRCGGIILNKSLDSVLIVLNRDSLSKGEPKWGLPKGHINHNELLHHCAKREIEEETGIIISRFIPNFEVYTQYEMTHDFRFDPPKPLEISYNKIVVFYLSEVTKNQSVKISNEHERYGWFTYKKAQTLLRFNNDLLKKANGMIDGKGKRSIQKRLKNS